MTYRELIDRLQLTVDDSSFDSMLGTFINEAQLEIAGGLPSAYGEWITPPLPQLFVVGTLSTATDNYVVDMPENFQRYLQFVASSARYEIDISETFLEFSENYPLFNQLGAVTECIEVGRKLYYQGIPTPADNLTIHYYRYPTVMVDDDDEPDGIPRHYQRDLLVNYAAWKIYELIEDDVADLGANTVKYRDLFYTSLRAFEASILHEIRDFKH